MNTINECAEYYATLLNKNYHFILEDKTEFVLFFQKRNFYHLLGLEKLKDVEQLVSSNPVVVFDKIVSGKITQENLQKSSFYPKISDRIKYFQDLQNMLDPNKCKVVVDFDKSMVDDTKLRNTKYILYVHREEGYVLFTIGSIKLRIYAETFFMEPSKKYVSGQNLLEVIDIEVYEKK